MVGTTCQTTSPTKLAKRRFAEEVAGRMGISTKAEPQRERPEATKGTLKQWVDLVKASEEVDVLEVLEAGRKHSSLWIQELHVWPRTSALELLSDNQTVANWCAGTSPVEGQEAQKLLRSHWEMVQCMLNLGLRPRTYATRLVSWVPRALTGAADLLCNMSMDTHQSWHWEHPDALALCRGTETSIRWIGDGGAREGTNEVAHTTIALVWCHKNRHYYCLGMMCGCKQGWTPAWRQEFLAIQSAIRWTSYWKLGS